MSISESGIDARAASSAFCLGVRPAFRIIFMTCLRRCQLGRGTDLAASRLPSGPARFLRAWAWCACRWRSFEACLASCPAFRSSSAFRSRWGEFWGDYISLNPPATCVGATSTSISVMPGVPPCAYALNCSSLRRFSGDGFLGIEPKPPIPPRSATKPRCWCQLAQHANQSRRAGSWGFSRNARMSKGGWPRGIFSRRVPRRE